MQANSMAIGKYECSAKNDHGAAVGNVELRVLNATRVVAFPRDQTIVAGQTIYLPCDVLHDPQLKPRVGHENQLYLTNTQSQVTWLIDGVPISQAQYAEGHYEMTR